MGISVQVILRGKIGHLPRITNKINHYWRREFRAKKNKRDESFYAIK